MKDVTVEIKTNLEKIALEIVTLEQGDIPAMGRILNRLAAVEQAAGEIQDEEFQQVLHALKNYFEKCVLGEQDHLEPVEKGLEGLQQMWRALANGRDHQTDTAAILKLLCADPGPGQPVDRHTPAASCNSTEQLDAPVNAPADAPVQTLSEEDIQILRDFVMEALENLESIEVNLIDLEQAADDQEIINAIFRPFHTIKGVSGFLNLGSINRLSHCTESLLDGARQGEFQINDEIIDVILESVDTLKQLIQHVEKALTTGGGRLDAPLDVGPLTSKIEAVAERAKRNRKKHLGEILLEKGAIRQEDLTKALEIQQEKEPSKKIGEILVEQKLADSRVVADALKSQDNGKRIQTLQVKVDTSKLDNLIDYTGELVIAQTMLRQNAMLQSLNDQALYQNLNQLTQIVSSLQKIAMSMRMVPIRSTFQKMVRLVRDLARNSGKEVALEMFGEETEIDRNVVDELYEPMVHMIRNAVDHGLEPPEERQAAGKSQQGKISLGAYHKGGNIVIEIQDDGRGLNKDRIIEKATANGLIQPAACLSDPEIYDLIFQPGFSTAREITDVSGRGVGMDVVKKGIEKLRGRLDIQSTSGQGSAFVISLPLTLAIIDGMVVRVGMERYVLPTMAIRESFQPKDKECHSLQGKGDMVMVRGNLIPLIRLGAVFDTPQDSSQAWEGLVVVVENKDQLRGLLIDELIGKEEVVIKSLGKTLKGIKGLAGGAILGDGRVGLILDIAGLFELSARCGCPRPARETIPDPISGVPEKGTASLIDRLDTQGHQ